MSTSGDDEIRGEFEERADGQERFEAGHDRPDDIDADGYAVGRKS